MTTTAPSNLQRLMQQRLELRNKIFNTGYQPKVGDLINVPYKLTMFGWSAKDKSLDLNKAFVCPVTKGTQYGTLVLVQEQVLKESMLTPARGVNPMSLSNLINAACRSKPTIWQIFDDSSDLAHSEIMTLGYIKGFLALGDEHLLWISTIDLKAIEYFNNNKLESSIIDYDDEQQ